MRYNPTDYMIQPNDEQEQDRLDLVSLHGSHNPILPGADFNPTLESSYLFNAA